MPNTHTHSSICYYSIHIYNCRGCCCVCACCFSLDSMEFFWFRLSVLFHSFLFVIFAPLSYFGLVFSLIYYSVYLVLSFGIMYLLIQCSLSRSISLFVTVFVRKRVHLIRSNDSCSPSISYVCSAKFSWLYYGKFFQEIGNCSSNPHRHGYNTIN